LNSPRKSASASSSPTIPNPKPSNSKDNLNS
jgi:hypothetical protein